MESWSLEPNDTDEIASQQLETDTLGHAQAQIKSQANVGAQAGQPIVDG